MNDYRSRLSANAEFDDPRFWRFERNSRLPRGTFDNGDRTERIVFACCAVLFVMMLAITAL